MVNQNPRVERYLLMTLCVWWGTGLAATIVLAWSSATQQPTPGCSFIGFGCDEVLASPYSRLLGVPLTTFALIYFAATAIILLGVFKLRGYSGAIAAIAVCLASVVGVATGVWSIRVMLFQLERICLWCVTVHAANFLFLLTGLALIYVRWRRVDAKFRQQHGNGLKTRPLEIAVICAVVLAGNQYMMLGLLHDRSEMRIVQVEGIDDAFPLVVTDKSSISTYIGQPQATRRVGIIVCFSCATCCELFQRLNEVRTASDGDDLRIDIRFAPFSSTCNPIFKRDRPNEKACKLARLAVAVASLDEQAFGDLTTWLFEHREDVTYPDARKKAEQLVSADDLERALDDDRVKQRMARDIEIAQRLRVTYLPQLVVPTGVVRGPVRTPEAVAAVLAESELGP